MCWLSIRTSALLPNQHSFWKCQCFLCATTNGRWHEQPWCTKSSCLPWWMRWAGTTIESSKSIDIGICCGLSFLWNAESPKNLQQTKAEKVGNSESVRDSDKFPDALHVRNAFWIQLQPTSTGWCGLFGWRPKRANSPAWMSNRSSTNQLLCMLINLTRSAISQLPVNYFLLEFPKLPIPIISNSQMINQPHMQVQAETWTCMQNKTNSNPQCHWGPGSFHWCQG